MTSETYLGFDFRISLDTICRGQCCLQPVIVLDDSKTALPDVGLEVIANSSCAEVESTKSVSEIYSPVAGEVVAVNTALADTPELLNTDPYGAGWISEIAPTDAGDLDTLLDAARYTALISE